MNRTVLVVEDDALSAHLLEAALRAKGHEVRWAREGEEGYRIATEELPDLILLDVMLPDLDGWEFLSRIRTAPHPASAAIPVILVTSRSSEQDRLRGLRSGADDYVTKPFSLGELVQRVENLLARAGAPARATDGDPLEDLRQALHHDLKNHLVAIAGFGRRLEADAEEAPPATVRRFAGWIRKSAEHLGSFLEDVLLFEKLEAGRWEAPVEPVDLAETVRSAVSLVRPSAEEKGLRLRTELADVPRVRFNELAAHTCLVNLLENAVKYTPEGGFVAVELKRCGPRVCLDVADSGAGVPANEAEAIFRKFRRGTAHSGTTKGTGLGLYLVKALTEALDASVELVAPGASPETGARFRMTFSPVPET